MPVTIIEKQKAKKDGTASFRQRRPGPESDLIDWFLHVSPIKTPRGCRVTAFIEPRLESGFPDLVLVIWNIDAARRWKPIRSSLKRHDFQIMHHMLNYDKVSYHSLVGLFAGKTKRSLEKLEEAEMVRKVGDAWQAKPLSQVFATQHIVAIEAKIGEWNLAIKQASLNRWFASSSYVLIPHVPRRSDLLKTAISHGVGVWTKTDAKEPHPIPETRRLPLSYASWFFNEWSCQHAWHVSKEELTGP